MPTYFPLVLCFKVYQHSYISLRHNSGINLKNKQKFSSIVRNDCNKSLNAHDTFIA